MKKFLLCLLFFSVFKTSAQIDFLTPYEISIESELAFAPALEEIDQMRLSFEAQKWPIDVLRYALFRLQQNPYMVSSFFIQVSIIHPNQSKKIIIPVPVNERYIRAFKTEEGFNENYINFLSDTYEWMLEGL
ncbi:hypothetical protein OAR07_02255 [Flavobacteriaceae bacterium]|nr:hypothetical protein [Flavobacteriaceae bacterium]